MEQLDGTSPERQADELEITVDEQQLSLQAVEIFVGHPNRRESLRGKNPEGLTVSAAFSIAKKIFKCPCCPEGVPIGAEHTVVHTVQASGFGDHRHVHTPCFHENILPTWHDVIATNPKHTSATANNKRARRYRYRHR